MARKTSRRPTTIGDRVIASHQEEEEGGGGGGSRRKLGLSGEEAKSPVSL